jgi:AraC-like DNA-binding protein
VRDQFRSEPGILYANTAREKFRLTSHLPAPELAPFVANYWTVSWDLSEPYAQRVLTRPGVNMTFKDGRSRIAGSTTGQFTEVLEGRHRVFGVRFRTGSFRAFLGTPVTAITDRYLGVDEVFGPEALGLEHALLSASCEEAQAAIMDRFLGRLVPRRDGMAALAEEVVAAIAADRSLARVDDVAGVLGIGTRRLQRLFAEYVGVGPKWVIRRFRINEALAAVTSGAAVNWAELANDLGYSDQAHFIRDFTAQVGTSPARYLRSLTANAVGKQPETQPG